jgi:hypothetical protein
LLSVSSHETDNACKDSNIPELQHIRAEPFVCSGRDGAPWPMTPEMALTGMVLDLAMLTQAWRLT